MVMAYLLTYDWLIKRMAGFSKLCIKREREECNQVVLARTETAAERRLYYVYYTHVVQMCLPFYTMLKRIGLY